MPPTAPKTCLNARCLTALPVYNEVKHLTEVLDQVSRHAHRVLVIDDGSTDGSRELLEQRDDILLVRHPENRGYGAALKTAFAFAIEHDYDVLVTIDCDGQHEPQLIGELAGAVFGGAAGVAGSDDPAESDSGPIDIVSGSRYLTTTPTSAGAPPEDRRRINQTITHELNQRLVLKLTDAFCGFKAYRVEALEKLNLTEPGYAMPLELWVQAAQHGLKIREVPVPLIYLDEERSFGGALDQAEKRLNYYREVICRACLAAAPLDSLCASSPEGGDPCNMGATVDTTSC